jgi:hypothetical protein
MRLVLAGDAGAGRTGEIAIAASVGGGLFSSRPRTLTRIVANVSTRDLDAYGGETSRSDTIFVDPRGDLRIPPGGEAALEFSFEGLTNPGVAARSVEVAVEVVPAETCLDGEPVYLTRFAVPACTVLALPAEYAGFAADPLTALGEILARPDAAADRSILPCALTVPREKRDDAIRTLAGKLIGAESPRSLAIIAALRELTGERDRGLDRAAWIGFASKVLTSARR